MTKILLDRNIGIGGDSIVADKLYQMGYNFETVDFPNKESILEAPSPIFLGGQTLINLYNDEDFQQWMTEFNQKHGTMTVLGEVELFHPVHLPVLKKIDSMGTPCRILSPWRFGSFDSIKEYHHDLNASFINPGVASPAKDFDYKFLAICNTTIKDSRPGRAQLIQNLKKIQGVMINTDGPTHDISTGVHRHPTKVSVADYDQSQLEVVCETDSMVNEIFYPTEKIYKPLSAGQPFMVFGTRHYLKGLRAKGFKTYDGFIDESYDEEADQDVRIEKICQSLSQLKNRNIKKESRAIARHNQKRFYEIIRSADVIHMNKLKKLVDHAILESKSI